MTKPKKSAPKTEAKGKASKPLSSAKVVMVEASTGEITEVDPKPKMIIEQEPKEVAVKTRFQVGDVIKHEHRLYQCISTNGHHDAVLALYSHQNNRADHSKVRTVSNDPSVNDGFVFSKY